MYAVVMTHFLFHVSRHNFVSSPRPNRSRYQKSPRKLSSSMSWLHADRVSCRLFEFSRRSISHSIACVLPTTLNSPLPVGMGWKVRVWSIYETRRSTCVPSFILLHASVFDLWTMFSDPVPGGAVEPPCHARVPSSARPWWPRVLTCVQSFRSFWAC
jgi:hypothetical protein